MKVGLILTAAMVLGGCTRPPATPEQTQAQRAYASASMRMHGGMATIDADPDVAFAQGMTAHHRGAVEMARVELRHGRDSELRKLATAIIAAQAGEITQMERWLTRHGRAPSTATHPSSANAPH